MEIKLVACDRCPAPTPGEVPEKAETRAFSFDGKRYKVDLCLNHMREFERTWNALAELAASSTQVVGRDRGPRTRKQVPPTATEPPAPAPTPAPPAGSAFQPSPMAEKIRAWAKANGHEVGDKGRISEELRRLYNAAHPPQPVPLRNIG